MTKIVAISDTHCQLDDVSIPEGDILLHSGDLTYRGTPQEISKELKKLSRYKDKYKAIILCEGNHDWLGARSPSMMDQMCKDNGIILLRDSSVTIEGLKFYGSPFQPEFCNWAFNLPRGEPLKRKWANIPDDTDVLITHGPPMGILDNVTKFDHRTSQQIIEHVGCEDLYNRIMELKDLKLHVFGHIHDGHGQLKMGNTTFVNASICTEEYRPTNSPICITI